MSKENYETCAHVKINRAACGICDAVLPAGDDDKRQDGKQQREMTEV